MISTGFLLPLTVFNSLLVLSYGHNETPHVQTNASEAYAQRTYFYAGGEYVNTTTVKHTPKFRFCINSS